MIITNQSQIEFNTVLPDGGTTPGSVNSNIVLTEIITYSFTKVKATEKPIINEGETVTQTVVLNNVSNFNLTDLTFSDTMSDGATYVDDSVTIDGISYPAFNLITGFPLPDIGANSSRTITYQIIANNPKTSSPVINHGTVNYTATDPVIGPVDFTENTNDVTIAILANEVDVIKNVNKTTAKIGETLHYTTTITNSGESTLSNLAFVDNLASELQFVNGSVKINGVDYPALNPNTIFSIPDLAPEESNTVEFDVVILNTASNFVLNFSTIYLSGEDPTNSNIVTTTITRVIPPVKPRPKLLFYCQQNKCACKTCNYNRRNFKCIFNMSRCGCKHLITSFNHCRNNFKTDRFNNKNCFHNLNKSQKFSDFNRCNNCNRNSNFNNCNFISKGNYNNQKQIFKNNFNNRFKCNKFK